MNQMLALRHRGAVTQAFSPHVADKMAAKQDRQNACVTAWPDPAFFRCVRVGRRVSFSYPRNPRSFPADLLVLFRGSHARTWFPERTLADHGSVISLHAVGVHGNARCRAASRTI
jgi:hypothetical protein